MKHVKHDHEAAGLALLLEKIERDRHIVGFCLRRIIPFAQAHAVQLPVPLTEELVIDGGRVVEQLEPVVHRKVRVPDAEIVWPVIDALPFQPVADAADEAVHLDVDVVLAVHSGPGRLAHPLLHDRRCFNRNEERRQIRDHGNILPVQHFVRRGEPKLQLEIEKDFKDQDGIQIEILVEAGIRGKAVEMCVVHMVTEDREDG